MFSQTGPGAAVLAATASRVEGIEAFTHRGQNSARLPQGQVARADPRFDPVSIWLPVLLWATCSQYTSCRSLTLYFGCPDACHWRCYCSHSILLSHALNSSADISTRLYTHYDGGTHACTPNINVETIGILHRVWSNIVTAWTNDLAWVLSVQCHEKLLYYTTTLFIHKEMKWNSSSRYTASVCYGIEFGSCRSISQQFVHYIEKSLLEFIIIVGTLRTQVDKS